MAEGGWVDKERGQERQGVKELILFLLNVIRQTEG